MISPDFKVSLSFGINKLIKLKKTRFSCYPQWTRRREDEEIKVDEPTVDSVHIKKVELRDEASTLKRWDCGEVWRNVSDAKVEEVDDGCGSLYG